MCFRLFWNNIGHLGTKLAILEFLKHPYFSHLKTCRADIQNLSYLLPYILKATIMEHWQPSWNHGNHLKTISQLNQIRSSQNYQKKFLMGFRLFWNNIGHLGTKVAILSFLKYPYFSHLETCRADIQNLSYLLPYILKATIMEQCQPSWNHGNHLRFD